MSVLTALLDKKPILGAAILIAALKAMPNPWVFLLLVALARIILPVASALGTGLEHRVLRAFNVPGLKKRSPKRQPGLPNS